MMLLSHFSSFLEIITAVYVSMCMDDVLKGIWSPKYYEDLKTALREYYLQDHDDFIDRIVNTNKQKADSIKQYMKNRATFFLVICLILLLLSGYEVTKHESNYLFHMSIFFTGFWAAILLLFNKYFFLKKKFTAIAIVLLIALSYWSYKNVLWYIPYNSVVNFVLILLFLPIIWQTFVCWMFSSAYKEYIRNILAEGKKNYKQAEKGLAEHNPKIIPERYKEIYKNISIECDDAEGAKARCLDQYLEIMETEIAETSNPKSVFNIFTSWLWVNFKYFLNNLAIKLNIKKRETISQQQS